MHIVHVFCQVKPEHREAFIEATLENARQSIQEPGIVRFDVIQQQDDPTRFVLMEWYRTPEDVDRHKETAHYNTWVQRVPEMLVEPRSRQFYTNLFPGDEEWE